jgi:hypothetical protein
LSTRPADHLVVRIPVVDQGCQIKVSQLIVQTVSVVIGMNANVWAFSKQTFSPNRWIYNMGKFDSGVDVLTQLCIMAARCVSRMQYLVKSAGGGRE